MELPSFFLAKKINGESRLFEWDHGASRQKQIWPVFLRTSHHRVYVIALCCVLFLLGLSLRNLPRLTLDVPSMPARPVLLLIWWLPFGHELDSLDCASHGVKRCYIATDKQMYFHADAVIFHNRELMQNPFELPQWPRPPGQKWIWMNFESPSHSGFLGDMDGVFNMTMTYRRDSDIFLPYGYLHRRRRRDPPIGSLRSQLASKPRNGMVAWVVSNWNEDHERVQFYWSLSQHLPIDVYGRQNLKLLNDSVIQTVSRYKFYLAFENSLHTDYITEKLWRNAIQSGAVPIVMGPTRENYERFLPSNAFIHVNDFSSPRALADYIKHLDRNPALYNQYLTWRRDYTVHVTSFWSEHFCAACKAVRAGKHQIKTIRHLSLWFDS